MIRRARRRNTKPEPLTPSDALASYFDAPSWNRAFDRFAAAKTNQYGTAVQGAPYEREKTFTKPFNRFGHDYGQEGDS